MTTRKVTINGKEKEAVWVDKQGEWGSHWEVDGIQFEGHINLWSFTYEPKTYLKESELSGDEWRKGGQVKIFRDGVCVYNEFSRTTDNAMRRIMINLPKLQEFDFDYLKVGRKIYNHDVPCTITRVLDDGELACYYCQSNCNFVIGMNYRNCFYNDLKCVDMLFDNGASRWKGKIDQALRETNIQKIENRKP